MKTTLRSTFGVAVAFVTLAAWAQTPPPSSSDTPPPSSTAPAATTSAQQPPTATATTETVSAPNPVAAQTVESSAAPAVPAPAAPPPAAAPAPAAPDAALRHIDEPTQSSSQPDSNDRSRRGRRSRSHNGDPRIEFGGDASLAKGESADAVVAIGGSASNDGDVSDAVVAIGGNARSTGSVGDAVVAILGDVYIDGEANDAVAILGDVELGPKAVVHGDLVSVGGTVKRDPKAIVHGHTPHIGLPILRFGNLDWLHAYISHCLFKGRILALAPNLGWAWGIAFGFLTLYVVLALLFRTGVDRCVTTLETRPGGTILTALLTLLLSPVLALLLIVTVVGIAVIPFFGLALLIATLFGKAALFAWLGRRVTRLFGEGPWSHPAIGVLIGGLIVMGLYLVPILGLILYKVIGVLGLGLVVLALFGGKRKTADAVAVGLVAPAMASASASSMAAGSMAGSVIADPMVASVPPTIVATTLPRAGFWIRIGGLLIDLVLVMVTAVFLPIGPSVLLLLAIYAAIMWKTKSTTIGGIVCGLQVVRLDGRPIDWSTAIVRALSCFLSLFAIGLGFIWVALDDEKRSWHDKIAGTTVVLSRSRSLV